VSRSAIISRVPIGRLRRAAGEYRPSVRLYQRPGGRHYVRGTTPRTALNVYYF